MKRFICMIMAVVIVSLKHSAVVRSQLVVDDSCARNGSYTSNSTYIANLEALLSSIPSNMSNYGFYASSVGTAQGHALCRADTTRDQCRKCVEGAASQLLESCRNQREGAVWEEYCLVHYSDGPTNDIADDSRSPEILFNIRNVSASNEYFREEVTSLVADLRVEAAEGSSELKVGVGTRTTTEVDSPTIYAMAQCTPDLRSQDCRSCLANMVDGMLAEAEISRGVRLLSPYCILRYELYMFYSETRLRELEVPLLPISPPPPPPPPPSPTENSRRGQKNNDTKKIISIVVPIVVCLPLVACALISLRKTMKWPRSMEMRMTETIDEIISSESLQYDLAQIRVATSDFSDANKLGQGGFGAVYRGRLQNGQEIAVKRLSKNSDQGNTEFKNEVVLVARLQHRNLVKLLGFSIQGTERLLVYEFVQNASLDQFIFDARKRSSLDWDTRHKIIAGVARGILYLHEDSRLRIIHRDLKASNILLDGDMNPKIADFGMARLSRHDETQGNTSKIVGTYGYMAPEYAMHGKFSIKSDVFSFGVLILEIVSGNKRNNYTWRGDNVEDLLTLTWENWREGTAENMIDPLLKNTSTSSLSEMMKCIHIGLLCVQENANNRPTMTSVLHMLSTAASTFPSPSEPAFYMANRFGPNSATSKNHDSSAVGSSCGNDLPVTELYPR